MPRDCAQGGRRPRKPVHVPGREGRAYTGCRRSLSNLIADRSTAGVIQRNDIVWLGVAAGVSGCLIGGMMLGIGMDLVVNGQPLGWLLLLPGAPVSAIPGWLLGRRLAREL
jgi:hypothetical protein